MRRTAAALAFAALAFAALAVAGPAHAADPPTPGGCKDFGENVAFLAEDGREFGELASFVASSKDLPKFSDAVVKPEQDLYCP